jgi:hypothetical protein
VKENIPVKKTLELIKLTNNFPIYKDLEPYKQYNFDLIQGLHENIILLLYELNDYVLNKENELQIHRKQQDKGLNINNFVTTFNYNILMTKEKGMLFISYIEFFHNLHTKYLQRFAMKTNLMYNQVTHDIRFEDGGKTETKTQELLNNFESDNIDKSLIKQIRRSFTDSDSNSSEHTAKSDNSKNNLSFKVSINKDTNIIPNETIESVAQIISLEKSRCLTLNSKNNSGDEKTYTSNEVVSNEKNKNLFKNRVKKMITGMRLFKKHHNEYTISSVSSESNFDEIKIPESPISTPLNSDDDVIIKKSKSAEEIFMEISKQCDELTVSFIYPQQTNDINLLGMDDVTDANMVENELDNIPVLGDKISKEYEIEENIINKDMMVDDNDRDIYVRMTDIYADPDDKNNEKEEEIEDIIQEVPLPLKEPQYIQDVNAKKKKRNNKQRNRR